MKALVTGSRGFIGTYVVRSLRERGVEVVECDSFEPRVHLGARAKIAFPTKAGAIPPDAIGDVDVIVHLAAQVGVADSWDDPSRYLEDNTYDTSAFLENVRNAIPRPRRLVIASSMSVYGDPKTWLAVDENTPARPASIYGMTKLDQEHLSLIYGETLGISTAALRFFNVYGPGQALHNPYTGVLAIFANRLLSDEHPIVYDDGMQTRDFVYVEDVAHAVVEMALGDAEGIFNVSTGHATTIYEVADSLAKALGVERAPHVTHEHRPGDVRHCIGHPARLREALGSWEPLSFSEGVTRYAEALKRRV